MHREHWAAAMVMAGYETYSLIVYRRQNAKKCNGCNGGEWLQRVAGQNQKPTDESAKRHESYFAN